MKRVWDAICGLDRDKRNAVLFFAALLAGLLLLKLAIANGLLSAPRQPGNSVSSVSTGVDAARCAEVRRTMTNAEAETNGLVVMREPGVMLVHPTAWARFNKGARDGAYLGLAYLKACDMGGSPSVQGVEVRSMTDNRKLAEGVPGWITEY